MTASEKSFWNESNNYFLTATEQCRGCGSLLAAKHILRAIYESTPNAMVFGRSCGGGRSEGSGMMGIQAAIEARGALNDRTLVVMTGDGRALEMGSGDFLASFDRGQKLTWILLDNQAYANAGSAANALTPFGVSTRIFTSKSGGKPTVEREMPLMMVFSQARYVATAAPAYVHDLAAKVRDAVENQPSYLHVYVPCQVSWIYSPEQVVELSRRMVQTGLSPLWSYKNGVFERTVKISESKKRPIQDFLKLQRRYEGITEEDIKTIENHVHRKNRMVDALESALNEPDTV
ncbi:MAG: hypothetical protein JRF41_09620 [Deltaproteobacteria bacterium]|nr:hypothetical protein [Deltaproteobacteria bacterium]